MKTKFPRYFTNPIGQVIRIDDAVETGVWVFGYDHKGDDLRRISTQSATVDLAAIESDGIVTTLKRRTPHLSLAGQGPWLEISGPSPDSAPADAVAVPA